MLMSEGVDYARFWDFSVGWNHPRALRKSRCKTSPARDSDVISLESHPGFSILQSGPSDLCKTESHAKLCNPKLIVLLFKVPNVKMKMISKSYFFVLYF